MTFDPFDLVVVPFPFADRTRSVVRPVVILSRYAGFGDATGVVLAAMVTSANRSHWPLDIPIADLDAAGLHHPCVIRMKLNSIDYGLIDRKIGALADPDRLALRAAIGSLLAPMLGDTGDGRR